MRKAVGVLAGGVGIMAFCLAGGAQEGSSRPRKIGFKAESAWRVIAPLRRASGANSSTREGYLQMPLTANPSKGKVAYRFEVATADTYVLWVRVRYANKTGNTLRASLNGEGPYLLGADETVGVWHWVGGKCRVHLPRGKNTLSLQNVAPGVQVDRVLLTADSDYSSSGRKRGISRR